MASSSLAASAHVVPAALPNCLAPSGAVVSQALPCAEGDVALLHIRLADVFEAGRPVVLAPEASLP
jgi:hypothetical protein